MPRSQCGSGSVTTGPRVATRPSCSPSHHIADFHHKIQHSLRTSLVAQWLRICLKMQEKQVQSLIGELRSHMLQSNYALEPRVSVCCNERSHKEGFPGGSVVKNLSASAGDQPLVQEDPICLRAWAPQLLSLCSRAQQT